MTKRWEQSQTRGRLIATTTTTPNTASPGGGFLAEVNMIRKPLLQSRLSQLNFWIGDELPLPNGHWSGQMRTRDQAL